ncbi:MAG TPA: serine hydrolase [Chryseosolibacter sp.]
MKKNQFFGLMVALVIGALCFFFSACDDNEPLGVNSAAPVFNIEVFEQLVADRINGLGNGNVPIGWAYVINKDGQYYSSDAFGKARTAADPAAIDFSENKTLNVASVSKFFTAIAVMQLLEERNLSLNAFVSPWLPPSFIQGAGPGIVNGNTPGLTFRDLLTHKSGLQSVNTNFPGTLCYTCMDNVIATGATGDKSQRNYLNVNFSLFRVIIPALWRGLPGGPPANEELTDANTQARYLEYMQKNVFTPSGVSSADCIGESPSVATIYYNANDVNATGMPYGDWTALAGGGGYYLSAIEIAKVLAHFENTETLVSNETRTLMRENRIGFDMPNSERERHGEYFGKNGSIVNNGKGVLLQTLSYPINHVELVVVMNTQGINFPNGNSLSDLMHRAYNDAWQAPKAK